MNNRANHEEPLKTTDDHCDLAVAAHLFRLAVPREYLRVVGASEAQTNPTTRWSTAQSHCVPRHPQHPEGRAHGRGLLDGEQLPGQFPKVIQHQAVRKWNIHITRVMSKHHFLGYAGRYIRRLPISQRRILRVSETEVIYQVKDARAKAVCEARSTPATFMALMAEHVPDRYQHSMRYFGLLSPRAKSETSEAVFQSLGQRKRARPQRISWRNSLIRNFQTDPLRDSKGEPMQWARRVMPS